MYRTFLMAALVVLLSNVSVAPLYAQGYRYHGHNPSYQPYVPCTPCHDISYGHYHCQPPLPAYTCPQSGRGGYVCPYEYVQQPVCPNCSHGTPFVQPPAGFQGNPSLQGNPGFQSAPGAGLPPAPGFQGNPGFQAAPGLQQSPQAPLSNGPLTPPGSVPPNAPVGPGQQFPAPLNTPQR